MSRNFELLQQAEKKHELLRPSGKLAGPTDGRRYQLDLEALTREEIAKLVQRVFLLPSPEGAPRMVLFTSAEHGDGCSWICARTSELLAVQVTGSVCVVDANLRSPSLHQHFDVENLCGLTDALVQSGPVRNFAQSLAGDNLWLVPGGSLGTDLNASLASGRLRSRMKELRTEFDYVLIDAPPVNLNADAIVLGQLADGIVLVVAANSTRREVARKAQQSLEAAKLRLLGAVLNKRTFPIPETLYRKL